MRLRVDFANGSWRIIDCDTWDIAGQVTVFSKDGAPVLTALTHHLVLVEPMLSENDTSTPQDCCRGSKQQAG